MSRSAIATRFFALQAAAVLLWWVGLALFPAWRPHFAVADAPMATLFAFAPPDLVLLAGGSAAVALGGPRRPWVPTLAALVAGAALYVTGYVATLWMAGVLSPLGAVLMAPSALLSTWAALVLSRDASRTV